MRQAPSSSTTDRRSRPRTSAILGLRACEPPPETSGLAESAIGAELIPHDPGGLQYHAPEECRIVPQVPAPQASRLCPQPEEPLKPAPLHPAGSSLLDSCVKVERRPDTDQHGSSETAQGHAVRSHQAGTVVNPPESLVPLTLHDPVHACNADVLRLPLSNPALDRVERLSHVDRAHPDAEDVDSLHPARRSCRVKASTGSAMRRVPPPYLATYWS